MVRSGAVVRAERRICPLPFSSLPRDPILVPAKTHRRSVRPCWRFQSISRYFTVGGFCLCEAATSWRVRMALHDPLHRRSAHGHTARNSLADCMQYEPHTPSKIWDARGLSLLPRCADFCVKCVTDAAPSLIYSDPSRQWIAISGPIQCGRDVRDRQWLSVSLHSTDSTDSTDTAARSAQENSFLIAKTDERYRA